MENLIGISEAQALDFKRIDS